MAASFSTSPYPLLTSHRSNRLPAYHSSSSALSSSSSLHLPLQLRRFRLGNTRISPPSPSRTLPLVIFSFIIYIYFFLLNEQLVKKLSSMGFPFISRLNFLGLFLIFRFLRLILTIHVLENQSDMISLFFFYFWNSFYLNLDCIRVYCLLTHN